MKVESRKSKVADAVAAGERSLVGWQGIVASVPGDWNLVVIGGDEKAGYFRADSAGSLLLEGKWSKLGPKADLRHNLDAYIHDLSRRARKRKLEFDHKIRAKESGALSFTWRSERKAQGIMWLCEQCGRVVMLQVSGNPQDDVAGIAEPILSSARDHSEDGWKEWAAYGLVAEVPPGYKLVRHQLMSGYAEFAFRKRNNLLTVERWGLANVALKKQSLPEWMTDRMGKQLRGFKHSIEWQDCGDGEMGLAITGRRRGIVGIARTIVDAIPLRRPARYLDALVWECKATNKIFALQSIHTAKEHVLDEALSRVKCH